MSDLAITLSEAPDSWQAPDWQKLWLALRADKKKPWQTLALVPAGSGCTPQTLLQIAVTLAHTGMVHMGAPIHVVDGTRVQLDQHESFVAEINQRRRASDMMLLALSALDDNVITLSLAKTADYSLLCVVQGQMMASHARKTVSQIGPQHFLGSAVFNRPSLG